MIVGESLMGVVMAGLIVATSNGAPLGLVPEDFVPAPLVGFVSFAVLVLMLYGWAMRHARR